MPKIRHRLIGGSPAYLGLRKRRINLTGEPQMAKAVHLKDLESRDLVRELEMLQESVPQPTGYTIQFWRDVQLYGLREAMMYFANNATVVDKDFASLKTRCNEILRMFNAQTLE